MPSQIRKWVAFMRGGGDVIAIILGIILGFRALYRLFKLKNILGLLFLHCFGLVILLS